MNRGSPTQSGSRQIDSEGFNEAPIHESGKFRRPESTFD